MSNEIVSKAQKLLSKTYYDIRDYCKNCDTVIIEPLLKIEFHS